MALTVHQVLNLVAQLGGDHARAAQELAGVDEVDPAQHGELLTQFGIDPQQLENGGYSEHLEAQDLSSFAGYQPGSDYTAQQPSFGNGQASGFGGQDEPTMYEGGGEGRGGYDQGFNTGSSA